MLATTPRLAFVLLTLLGVASSAQADATNTAQHILNITGVRGGLVVHLGCGDGHLTAALRAGDGYLVQGLDTDQANVAEARQHIRSLGQYGPVSIDTFDGRTLPYADNLVNLIVVDAQCDVPRTELMRVLSPQGVACVEKDGKWTTTVKPWPDEIDEWTHYLHGPSGNAVSQDARVGPPRRYQWIAPPRYARSHDHLSTTSAMVSSAGRVFYIVDEGSIASVAMQPKWSLVARDAFSGVLLWKRSIGPWEGHLRDFRSGPTELARRLVAVGDRVYVTLGYGKPVSLLDAASGETIREYDQTEDALEIVAYDDTLLVVVGDRLPDNTAGAAKPVNPTNIWHWWPVYEETPPKKHLLAVDASSGRTLWTKDDEDTVELMPSTLAAAGSRVFYQSHKELLALDVSDGDVLWRAERTVNRRRPSWSAPTLVVYNDVVLCADRAVESALPPGIDRRGQSQWVVDSRGGNAPEGQIIAFSADSGRRLWQAKCREGYNSPVDLLVADGLVWSGNLVVKNLPGITAGLDVHTGQVARTRPKDSEFFNLVMGHHRCYRNKATQRYLMLGRDGIETIDLASGEGQGHAWVRGACQYGVMPCNGLTYVPPHSCACHVESMLNSFKALAAAAESEAPDAAGRSPADRLEEGPAHGRIVAPVDSPSSDWPTYRHDAARSGCASSELPARLTPAWTAELPDGRLSAPVVADGRLFVASIDTHAVSAVDAQSGQTLWTFTAGGRVDSPPTIHRGRVLFGSADGWLYCLDSADGRLSWRFHVAKSERRIVSYGQLESAWPLHGSVLVRDDVVYAVAGRTPYLDGGMTLCRLDVGAGELLSETPIIDTAALPDVLSCDGTSIFMRHRRFDLEGAAGPSNVRHLYSPAGFLDASWWHRTYWLVGSSMSSGWGSWPNSAMRTQAGRIIALDGQTAYGYGRLNQYHRNGVHVGLGHTRYYLYASDTGAGKPVQPNQVATHWSRTLPIITRAMTVRGETLLVAGPPDVYSYAPEGATDPYHDTSAAALAEQEAAMAGQRGGRLLVVSTDDGRTMLDVDLGGMPVFDGMAVANRRLYVSLADGTVVCLR